MTCCVILTTTDKKEIAEQIAAKLIESKFAACVQIDLVHSYFYWDGKLCSENEYRLMIKTKKSCYNSVAQKIKDIHNYDLPEIIMVDITGGDDQYLNWLETSSNG